MPAPEPTIFVVDDDPDMRHSLQLLLQTMNMPVRVFSSADAFYTFYRREFPGCLVLDIRMPGQSGLELYERLLQNNKRIPAIFITAHADVSTAVSAMKTGAIEFLEKPFDRESLLKLARRAIEVDRTWREREQEFSRIEDQIGSLTVREKETLALLTAGESNKAMAAKLFISERAVEMRRANIMRKLSVRTLAELLDVTVTHRILSELHAVTDRVPVWVGCARAHRSCAHFANTRLSRQQNSQQRRNYDSIYVRGRGQNRNKGRISWVLAVGLLQFVRIEVARKSLKKLDIRLQTRARWSSKLGFL